MSRRVCRGFTLVELLVSIAIIGILMSLILPAVQAAREAARRTQCKDHLHNLALAMEHHLEARGHYPTNGWGYLWFGEPERGSDPAQPGGWIYNVLPYLEQAPLRRLGEGDNPAAKPQTLAQVAQTPLPVFECPSRPGSGPLPASPKIVFRNVTWAELVAKTDYAACEGDYITDTRGGPASLVEGDSPFYAWKDVSGATGVCYLRSRVRAADVRDGLSTTVMLGEKYVSTGGYLTADDLGHDQSMYSGVDVDINRWTLEEDGPQWDGEESRIRAFGSAHAGGPHFAFCDGRVRAVSQNVNRRVYRLLGNRRDGKPVSEETF